MSLLIELKVVGKTVDGTETWWDDVETAMRGRRNRFPVLSTIDPYDDIVLDQDDLNELLAELGDLATDPRTADVLLVSKLIDLCKQVLRNPNAVLSFTGD